MTESMTPDLDSALQALRLGRPIIVVDDEERENEGDLVLAAQFARPEDINFMARNACGLVCIAMDGHDLDRLGIGLMVPPESSTGAHASPFTVSVEARHGVTTGISAADRARTANVLASPDTDPGDLTQPGHMFPLRAHPDGVLARQGHTEAGVDLMRLAGLRPAAVLCEIMNEDGTMARAADLRVFADRYDLPIVSIATLVAYRRQQRGDTEVSGPTGTVNRPPLPRLRRTDEASLPTRFGPFRVTVYSADDGSDHLLLMRDDPEDRRAGDSAMARDAGPTQAATMAIRPAKAARSIPLSVRPAAPLVRLHSECLTGDALGSVRCDCGDQLHIALSILSEEPGGILLYLRQEGRGIGLANKIKAYGLQDAGLDTVEANTCLGFEADARDYAVAAAMLRDVGVGAVRLLTNNPSKVDGLLRNGIGVVERISLQPAPRDENVRYLRTKVDRLGHLLEPVDARASNHS